jgi:6,7-dimethyl-8-ribityllumazine synthase
MSSRESWPGEQPDISDVEDEVEEAESEVAEAYDEGSEDTDDDPELRVHEHVDDGIEIPEDVELLEGEVRGARRGVGIVLARTAPATANTLLTAALEELGRAGVGREHVTVLLVPGPFELALGAMALAKTRRYSCVIALGDATASAIVAGEAASGLQLAALETGIPVSFGVLTGDGHGPAAAHGAEAVRTGLEMADVFQQLRATAKAHSSTS